MSRHYGTPPDSIRFAVLACPATDCKWPGAIVYRCGGGLSVECLATADRGGVSKASHHVVRLRAAVLLRSPQENFFAGCSPAVSVAENILVDVPHRRVAARAGAPAK